MKFFSLLVVGFLILPITIFQYFWQVPRNFRNVGSFFIFVKAVSYYFAKLRKFPNVWNPTGFNERIQWLKLFDQSEVQILCSDKAKVKDYVEDQKIQGLRVPKTLKYINQFSDLSDESLPEEYVLKLNHDSGSVRIVTKGDRISLQEFSIFLKRKARNFGDESGEWAYKYIEPQIFAEEKLGSNAKRPPDFKFFCLDGEVAFCHYIFDRDESVTKEKLLSPEFKDIGINLHPLFRYHFEECAKPDNWESLKKIASKLSRGHKFVRIDLYSVDDEVYFGEFTFWPQSGTYRGSGQLEIESLVAFDTSHPKKTIFR